jgi:two-component system, NarL family, sensor kinase
MIRLITVLIPLLVSNCAICQKALVDSLEQRLAGISGTEKAIAYYEIINFYSRADLDVAQKYVAEFDQYLSQSKSRDLIVYKLLSQSSIDLRTGEIEHGIELLTQASIVADSLNNLHALTRINTALGYAFIASGKAEKGLDHLFKALENVEILPDREMEMKARINIPWAYLEMKQYRDCIEFGKKNLALLDDTEYEWTALYTYNNMAVAYGALKLLDSAKYFVGKGIAAASRTGDNQSLANGYFILGKIYADAGNYDDAIKQYLKARPYREKVGNPFFLASDLYAMSDLYYQKGEYAKGIAAGNEALSLAEKHNFKLKLEGAYLSLAKNYEASGDFKNSSNYYRLYAAVQDSIYHDANAKAIAEMQTRYETEKKEKQLILQQSELSAQKAELQKTYIIIAALVTTLCLISVIFFLLRSRMKRKHEISEKEREIFTREIQIQASIQSQETERKRFAQDLHDGMGQLISALRLALHSVNRDSSIDDRVAMVDRGEKILNEMYREIRSIAFNLMPQTLVQQGLVPAVKEMSDRINGAGNIQVIVRSFDMPDRLSEIQEISLFRVIQEWVNNVIKYAAASNVSIQLIKHDDEINVTIEDDGRGFDVQSLNHSTGNGWKNMKSRMNLLKGSIEIDSKVNIAGSTLILSAPLYPQTQSSHPIPNPIVK